MELANTVQRQAVKPSMAQQTDNTVNIVQLDFIRTNQDKDFVKDVIRVYIQRKLKQKSVRLVQSDTVKFQTKKLNVISVQREKYNQKKNNNFVHCVHPVR